MGPLHDRGEPLRDWSIQLPVIHDGLGFPVTVHACLVAGEAGTHESY